MSQKLFVTPFGYTKVICITHLVVPDPSERTTMSAGSGDSTYKDRIFASGFTNVSLLQQIELISQFSSYVKESDNKANVNC